MIVKLDRMLAAEELRELLDYNPDNGDLRWKERDPKWFDAHGEDAAHVTDIWNVRFAGKMAGSISPRGYRRLCIFNRMIPAHRAIWCMTKGNWPDAHIDHINGIRSDNRLCNLRDVPRSLNQRNLSKMSTNSSGVTGVYKCKDTGLWRARFRHDEKHVHLGRFASLDDAAAALRAKRVEYGYTERHGLSPSPLEMAIESCHEFKQWALMHQDRPCPERLEQERVKLIKALEELAPVH